MSEHAKEQSYEEMIQALQRFEYEILSICENLQKAHDVCDAELKGDSISENSGNNLAEAIRSYRAVVTKSTELRKKLAADLREVIEIERMSREVQN